MKTLFRFLDAIYISFMVLVSAAYLVEGFLSGFRYGATHGLFFLLPFVFVFLCIITLAHFLIIFAVRLRAKVWIQNRWTNWMMLVFVVAVATSPFLSQLGQKTAYSYAGLDNIIKDADALMMRASEDHIQLDRKDYPISFQKVGATRVHYSCYSVSLVRWSWVGRRSGLVVYFDPDLEKPTFSGKNTKHIMGRLYEFHTL